MDSPLSLVVLIEQLVLAGKTSVPLSCGVGIHSNPPRLASISYHLTYHRYRY